MNRKVGVLLSYVMMIFEVLSTLLLTPLIIRTLGQAEFGVYKLSSAVTAYLLLLDLGVGNAIIRYIAKFKAEHNILKERQFFGVATIFYAAIGVLSIVSGAALTHVFPRFFAEGLSPAEIHLGQKLLMITSLNCAVTLATTCFSNILIAYEKFALSRLCSIVQIIVKIAATYAALKAGMGSIGIVMIQLILTVFLRLFMVVYVFAKMKLYPIFRNIDLSFVKEIVVYSSLIFLQMIATQLNTSLDQILIGRMVSSSAVIIAVYGVGSQIVQYYQQIGTAFTSVLMPGVVQMITDHASSQKITEEMVRIGRIIFIVLGLIWCCFLVNGREFIVLWAGADNINAYYVTAILMFAYLFILTESIGTQILWAMNAHKEQSYLKMAIVLLNIVLTIFLIRWNPLIGATIGTFISLMLGDIGVMNLIFKRKLGVNLVYYYTSLLKGFIPCLLCTFLAGALTLPLQSSWSLFILKNGIMVCVYGITMWFHGMNHYEKSLVMSIVRGRRAK